MIYKFIFLALLVILAATTFYLSKWRASRQTLSAHILEIDQAQSGCGWTPEELSALKSVSLDRATKRAEQLLRGGYATCKHTHGRGITYGLTPAGTKKLRNSLGRDWAERVAVS